MGDKDKHKKYKPQYGENEIYWGFGLEEETYLQFEKPLNVAITIFNNCHTRERYSVDYYKSYAPDYKSIMNKEFTTPFIQLPYYMNSHSFLNMDIKGQHKTTYAQFPLPNTKAGDTLFEMLKVFNPKIFKDMYELSFTFDGDTIEFMTQKFYKARIHNVIKELLYIKSIFLISLNKYIKIHKYIFMHGNLIYPPKNAPYTVYHSNPANIAMFNNGTYHINITLPTMLGPKDISGNPTLMYPEKFKEDHKKCIRLYQWLEPILVANYGTPDPLSRHSNKYSKASQRSALSRYIGLGTYDTDSMKEGKILTVPCRDLVAEKQDFWWYKKYHETSGYIMLESVGMDINYKKHYTHGIELRMLDWFDERRLKDICKLLVYIADASYHTVEILNPALSETWNNLVVAILQEGIEYILPQHIIATYEKIFNVELLGAVVNSRDFLTILRTKLKKKYSKGLCSKLML